MVSQLYDSTIITRLILNLTPRNKINPTSKAFSQLFTPSFLKQFIHFVFQIPYSLDIPHNSYLTSHSFAVSLTNFSSFQPLNTAGSLNSRSSLNILTHEVISCLQISLKCYKPQLYLTPKLQIHMFNCPLFNSTCLYDRHLKSVGKQLIISTLK